MAVRCPLWQVRISLVSGLSGVGREVGVFVGGQSVTLGRSGLHSVVSSVEGMVSMLVMYLISFVMFTFASNVCCCASGVVVCSLARRFRSVALLRSVVTSL
jgi:hypothetical protein